MQNLYDYKKYAVLYVDDEEKSLKSFRRAFQDEFHIFTAPNVAEGIKILEAHKDEIGVLMTDQRMPGEKGVSLLEKARQVQPQIVRMLVTAYADHDAVVAAVNAGAIYRYVTKPWDPAQLETTLKRALEFFIVQQERDQLLSEKMSVLHNMMMVDRVLSLGLLSAGMSHHMRNALVAVKTFLELVPVKLEEELAGATLKDSDFWREYHHNVQGQVDKIQSLLDDLWSAAEKPTFDFVDEIRLRELVGELKDQLQPQFDAKKIELENEIPETLPPVKVDKVKFKRLFELLFRDELASLPPGCKVTLTGQAGEANATSSNHEIQIEIRDNGPGLSEDALRNVFDPFVARSDSPSEYGINLMACYLIVHHHGGKMSVRSQEGQGTVFTLRLRTSSSQPPLAEEGGAFSQKLLLNQTLWQKVQGTD